MNEAVREILTSMSFLLQFANWQTPDCPALREKFFGVGLKFLDRGLAAVSDYAAAYMKDEFKPTMERHLSSET